MDRYEEYNRSLKAGALRTLSEVDQFYKGNWILDVGSNTGMFVECVLERFPEAHVLGFEPVQRYYQYAVNRFKDNESVFFENRALSDKAEASEIFVAAQNIGWNTMVVERVDEDNAHTKEAIRTVAFDRYYEYTGLWRDGVKFDIVKIDTEGYEHKVIQGMRSFLKEQKPTIICEVGWGCSHPHWNEELVAFEYLFSIGYSRDVEQRVRDLKETTDIVFHP